MAFSTIILVGGILLLLMHLKNRWTDHMLILGTLLTSLGASSITLRLLNGNELMHFLVLLGLLTLLGVAWFIYSLQARRKQHSNHLG